MLPHNARRTIMDPTTTFCPNRNCPARGQTGQGNIGIHSQKEHRFICHACHHTFSARKGTVFYRLRTSAETVVIVVTLLAHGCPLQAIVAAFAVSVETFIAFEKVSEGTFHTLLTLQRHFSASTKFAHVKSRFCGRRQR